MGDCEGKEVASIRRIVLLLVVAAVFAPIIFRQLIGTGDRGTLLIGYLIAAGLMIVAALVELIIGVRAERRSLESIAAPLTAIKQETGAA